MAAVAAEAAATASSPGEGGAGEAEPEMEPIPGSEAGTDTLPVTATEASVPDGEADGQQSSPQADEPPLSPPRELARSPEAARPELEAEEKLPARVVEPAAAAPQEGPDLPPSPAPPEQPAAPQEPQEPPASARNPGGRASAVPQLIPARRRGSRGAPSPSTRSRVVPPWGEALLRGPYGSVQKVWAPWDPCDSISQKGIQG